MECGLLQWSRDSIRERLRRRNVCQNAGVNNARDLALIIKSRFPLVVVETNEERRMLDLIDNVCNLENWAGYTWTIADGIRRIGGVGGIPDTNELQQTLRHIDN